MIIIKTVRDYLYDKEISIEVTPEEVVFDIFKEYDSDGALESLKKKIEFLASLITSKTYSVIVHQLVDIANNECANKFTIKEENNDSVLDNK